MGVFLDCGLLVVDEILLVIDFSVLVEVLLGCILFILENSFFFQFSRLKQHILYFMHII